MAEQDAFSSFDMDQFQKPSIYLKWEAGKALVLRVLTVDPVLYSSEFTDKKTQELVIATKFAFIVYNFTAKKAQVMQTTPNLAKKLQELHVDPDFGANIRQVDLKITPPAPGVIAAYEVQVLPKAQEMSNEQVTECMKIDLDKLFSDKGGMRMTAYDPKKLKGATPNDGVSVTSDDSTDTTDTKIDDTPINLDDIPF